MADQPLSDCEEVHLRYYAVYGACVAQQVWDRIRSGYGPPDDELMKSFVEEAHAVAIQAEECQPETDTPKGGG